MLRGSQRGVESERERDTESEHAQTVTSEWERCRDLRRDLWVSGGVSGWMGRHRPSPGHAIRQSIASIAHTCIWSGIAHTAVLHILQYGTYCSIAHTAVLHILQYCNILRKTSIAVVSTDTSASMRRPANT